MRDRPASSAPPALTVAARPRVPPVSRPGDARERAAERASSRGDLPGTDFSRVRIHTGDDADSMARLVGARAFTVRDQVVFARGEYDPGSPGGRALLAHELAHVAQDNTDAIHRVPGRDAPDSWRAIVPDPVTFTPNVSDRHGPAQEAVNRLLRLAEGARLVNQLWQIFCGRGGTCRSRIRIRFVDEHENLRVGEVGADGHFSPDAPDEPVYTVLVKYRAPLSPEQRARSLGGSWPGGTGDDIHFSHADSESDMANTIFHELLHIWFVHAHRDAPYPTGHRDATRGEIDPIFRARLQTFSRELDALEDELRPAAAAQAPPPPALPRDVPDLPPARPPAGPGSLGGDAALHGGWTSGPGGGRYVAVAGADLILRNLHSLRLGVRGVYLTPETLLAGGTVGLRLLESPEGGRAGERVERPLFFDLEAGVLTELTPNQTQRVSNAVVAIGSVGIGQEFGTSGTRFYWRAGGMVLISDRDVRNPGVGATLGAGLRF